MWDALQQQVECRSAWLEVRFAESSAGRQANVRYGSASVIRRRRSISGLFPEAAIGERSTSTRSKPRCGRGGARAIR